MADHDREALELRIDNYLDGLLTPAEARMTERMFIEPEVGAVLAEALALRELMALGADATPDGLAERISGALGVGDERDDGDEGREGDEDGGARLGRTRSALYGASWMVRGAGVPLALVTSRSEPEAEPAPKKAWWRPALKLVGGR